MATAVQPSRIGSLLTTIRDQLVTTPEKSGLRALAQKTLAQLEEQRIAWSDTESSEFFSKYSEIVQQVKKLSAAPEAAADEKVGNSKRISWQSGAEWPAWSFFQPHPEFDFLANLSLMNVKYNEFRQQVGASDELVYDHQWDQSQTMESKISKQFYNICRFINQKLPPETLGFV